MTHLTGDARKRAAEAAEAAHTADHGRAGGEWSEDWTVAVVTSELGIERVLRMTHAEAVELRDLLTVTLDESYGDD